MSGQPSFKIFKKKKKTDRLLELETKKDYINSIKETTYDFDPRAYSTQRQSKYYEQEFEAFCEQNGWTAWSSVDQIFHYLSFYTVVHQGRYSEQVSCRSVQTVRLLLTSAFENHLRKHRLPVDPLFSKDFVRLLELHEQNLIRNFDVQKIKPSKVYMGAKELLLMMICVLKDMRSDPIFILSNFILWSLSYYLAIRPGSIVVSSGYEKMDEIHCLCWKDVNIQRQYTASPWTTSVILRYFKGFNMDTRIKKRRNLGAAQDCRLDPTLLILSLGIRQRVFNGIETIEDLNKSTKLCLTVKQECEELPVLTIATDHTKALSAAYASNFFKKISRRCGFAPSSVLYSWRHESLHSIQQQCGSDVARAAANHQPDSTTLLNTYIDLTREIDFVDVASKTSISAPLKDSNRNVALVSRNIEVESLAEFRQYLTEDDEYLELLSQVEVARGRSQEELKTVKLEARLYRERALNQWRGFKQMSDWEEAKRKYVESESSMLEAEDCLSRDLDFFKEVGLSTQAASQTSDADRYYSNMKKKENWAFSCTACELEGMTQYTVVLDKSKSIKHLNSSSHTPRQQLLRLLEEYAGELKGAGIDEIYCPWCVEEGREQIFKSNSISKVVKHMVVWGTHKPGSPTARAFYGSNSEEIRL